MEYWRPVYGHPAGSSARPWFRVIDEFAYPAGDAFEDATNPWYRSLNGFVYRAHGHPEGESSTADFRIVGSIIYPIAGPDRGPWFQIVDRPLHVVLNVAHGPDQCP